MAVVLFDGTCNLCNGAVQFMIDRDRSGELKFAALQSEPGAALLLRTTTPEQVSALVAGATGKGDPDTIVLLEDGQLFTHSTAALKIAAHLGWPWSWLRALVIVPRFVRDAIYRWVARNRYRWFGKTETCRVPTAELRARFL